MVVTIIRATMSQLNIIVSPDDLEIKAMERFIVIKSKASAEIILTLGVDQIKPLHEALNQLYEIRATTETT
jgi:hypothetical protein